MIVANSNIIIIIIKKTVILYFLADGIQIWAKISTHISPEDNWFVKAYSQVIY